MLLIPRQHTGPVGRLFEPKLDRSSYPHQKYAAICPTWLPKALQTIKPSLLERLPGDIQRLIFSNLDYQSLIFLSMVNRHFQRSVDPQRMATSQDKFEFVMRAAKDFPQHWASEKNKNHQPGNSECYWCFRVRAPEYFDVLQDTAAYFDPQGRVVSGRHPGPGDRLVPLRRFCIGCGVKIGLHAPSDYLISRTGQNLWVCRCRRVWQKPNCLRCPDCSSSCPLRPKKQWHCKVTQHMINADMRLVRSSHLLVESNGL